MVYFAVALRKLIKDVHTSCTILRLQRHIISSAEEKEWSLLQHCTRNYHGTHVLSKSPPNALNILYANRNWPNRSRRSFSVISERWSHSSIGRQCKEELFQLNKHLWYLKHCRNHNLGEITKKKNDAGDEWETLLDNEKKRMNTASIPSRRENIFTIPNLLSLSRIIATPYIAYLILDGRLVMASALLFIAGITDILDGQIARRWPSQKSAFGTALDPLGDKILVTVLTLTLAKASMLPLTLAALIIGRDMVLIISVFYLRYRTCPPPVTLKRYFDPTLVNTQLNPTTISKVNTVLQVAAIWFAMVGPVFNITDSPVLQCLYGITGVTTIWSGLSYVFNKNTVQILKDK